jgi:hypothetical protein
MIAASLATPDMIRDGGVATIAIVVFVGSLIALWRFVGAPMFRAISETSMTQAATANTMTAGIRMATELTSSLTELTTSLRQETSMMRKENERMERLYAQARSHFDGDGK